MVWIFCPEMTLAQFPKSKFWNFCWIFCPEMTLAQFPEFGFFVQNSRIGVIPTCVHHFLRHLSEIKEQTADPTRLDRIQVLTFILHACDICHPGPGYHLRITTTLTSNIFCARTFLKIVC